VGQGRIYTVEFEAVATTVAVDFFELQPADDKPVNIFGLFLSQSSDFGDAQDENLRYQVVRGHTTSGAGGTSPTPRPLNRSEAAAGFTAECNNTGAASGGTTHNLHSDVFNVRAGLGLWLPEGAEWNASQADTTLVVRLKAAPADSLTMSGTLYVEELG